LKVTYFAKLIEQAYKIYSIKSFILNCRSCIILIGK